jgi:hypothetical protein
MAVQVQLRRGTAAQWTVANTTLASGEIGVEVDTSRFKIGNGTSTWVVLPYGNTIGGNLSALDDVYAVNPADGAVIVYNNSINKWVATTDLEKQNMDGGFY